MSLDDSYKRVDDVYYPINDIIDMMTVRTDELKKEIYMIQRQTAISVIGGKSRNPNFP